MKKVLLSFALISSVLLTKAQQQLPYTETINNGTLSNSDWYNSLNPGELGFATYQDPVAGCATNNAGFVVNKDPLNTNPTLFVTPNLKSISNGSQIAFRFSLYAFNGGTLTCANSIPCNLTMKIFLVNSTYNFSNPSVPPSSAIIAESASTTVSTGNSTTPTASISSPIVANITPGTNFRVVLQVESLGTCGTAPSYVIDNVNIVDVGQTVTPVSFKAFNASRNKSNVSISWTTASEQNNSGFNIQRNDGNGWKNVAFVFSQAQGGNSASDLTYSYTDPNNIKGISQYRIQQVDIDGKSKFSEIRSVKGEEQLAKLVIYPNPSSNGNINVVFDGQASHDVNVTDFSGRLIKKYSSVVNNLEIKGLTTGVYSILVTEKLTGVKFVQKVVVK